MSKKKCLMDILAGEEVMKCLRKGVLYTLLQVMMQEMSIKGLFMSIRLLEAQGKS